MEIKIFNLCRNFFFTIMCAGFFAGISANDEINFSPNKLKIPSIENITNERNISPKDPLKDVVINLNTIFSYSDNLKFEKNLEKLDFNSSRLEIRNELILNSNEYFLIKTIDDQSLAFNGSLLIQFYDLPNLQDYGDMNNLIFIKDLSDVNSAIFKIDNFLDLKIIVDTLKKDINIKSIELNTINLNLEPK